MTASPPGFDSPAVGFDQPFEMLEACHDRVRRSLALLGRLLAYLSDHPHDAQSRSAARDVLRYFELAAPLHHQDEERHVFPRLAGDADAALTDAVARLRADHARMESLWRAHVLATLGGILVVGVGGGLVQPMAKRWEGYLTKAEDEMPRIKEQAANAPSVKQQAQHAKNEAQHRY